MGREFSFERIYDLPTLNDVTLEEGLNQLVESELLYQRGRPPCAKYVFKHALVKDAAYGSLLRRAREKYHSQVAELIEAKYPDIVEAHPELVAHHFNRAAEPVRAVLYWQKAAEQAALKSANLEAIDHAEQGVAVLATIPDGPERDRYELNLLVTKCPALVATKGYAAAEIGFTYRRALELSQNLGDTTQQFSVLLGLKLFHYVRDDLREALNLARQAMDLAKSHPEPGFDLAAERAHGFVLVLLGDFTAARDSLERVWKTYDIEHHGSFAFQRGGSDFGALVLGADYVLLPLGYPDQAKNWCEQGLALANKLGHPISQAFAHWHAAQLYLTIGEVETSVEHTRAMTDIAEEKGFPQYIAWTALMRGSVMFEQGKDADAIDEIAKGIDACRSAGSLVNFLSMPRFRQPPTVELASPKWAIQSLLKLSLRWQQPKSGSQRPNCIVAKGNCFCKLIKCQRPRPALYRPSRLRISNPASNGRSVPPQIWRNSG